MPSTVTIIEESDGEEFVRERIISTVEFSVKLDTDSDGEPDTLFTPIITEDVEMENASDQSEVQDQCGNTERRRASNQGWSITVKGMVTAAERYGNLDLATLRDVVAPADDIIIRSDIINGEFALNNTLIGQRSDLVSINTVDTDGDEKVYDFQLQIGETESDQ
jgi:hypothetical protein